MKKYIYKTNYWEKKIIMLRKEYCFLLFWMFIVIPIFARFSFFLFWLVLVLGIVVMFFALIKSQSKRYKIKYKKVKGGK